MIVAALALAATLGAPRFFLQGDGTLTLVNAHSGDRAAVTYRHPDGEYDAAALARLRRVMRSRDGTEGDVSLRLIELLAWVSAERDHAPLTIQSGYRSPDYNDALRARGARAASGSLHTEGLAADVAFPKRDLKPLWLRIRALDCCGAGFYQSEGFLHLDVGRPRFWEPSTSKVEQNLSAGNALLFARTEFDRYATGEPIVVRLHALTAPPIRIAREATLVPDHSGDGDPDAHRVRIDAENAAGDGCIELDGRGARLTVRDVPAIGRGRLVLRTCEPRVERTPQTVQTNPIEVRPRGG